MKLKLSWQLFQVGSEERALPCLPAGDKITPEMMKALYKAVDHYKKTGKMLKEIKI